MAAASKQSHLTFGDCQIIQKRIENGSSKKAMANLPGKDKSTIGKEIRLHRELTYKSRLPLECAAYAHCKFNRICRPDCVDYVPFTCTRRDRSPGACKEVEVLKTEKQNLCVRTMPKSDPTEHEGQGCSSVIQWPHGKKDHSKTFTFLYN